MSNNIAVITQEEIEPEIERDLTLTMALPGLAPASIPKSSKKKLHQKEIFEKKEGLEGVKVQAHMRGSKIVHAYEQKLTTNNKKDKRMKPKKKAATKQPKHAANPKVRADCKKSVKLARHLDLVQ
jgi:hypothetical protein